MSLLLSLVLTMGQAAPVAVAPAAVAPVTVATVEPEPGKMSRSQIRAHNASLDRADPNFIVCRRSATIGSLVERNYSCRTVAQWARADVQGNTNARETMDAMASKAGNSSN